MVTNGDYRLVPIGLTSHRLFQAKYQGQWGSVCYSGMGSNTASVLCRSVGLEGNSWASYSYSYSIANASRFSYMDVACTGLENDLGACPKIPVDSSSWSSSSCSVPQSNSVSVACEEPLNITFRLQYGGNSGTLLATVNGQEGYVCDDLFDSSSAAVVCRSMGLPWQNAREYDVTAYSYPFVLDDVQCTGRESQFKQCSYSREHNCYSAEVVGLTCSNSTSGGGGSSTYTSSGVNMDALLAFGIIIPVCLFGAYFVWKRWKQGQETGQQNNAIRMGGTSPAPAVRLRNSVSVEKKARVLVHQPKPQRIPMAQPVIPTAQVISSGGQPIPTAQVVSAQGGYPVVQPQHPVAQPVYHQPPPGYSSQNAGLGYPSAPPAYQEQAPPAFYADADENPE